MLIKYVKRQGSTAKCNAYMDCALFISILLLSIILDIS